MTDKTGETETPYPDDDFQLVKGKRLTYAYEVRPCLDANCSGMMKTTSTSSGGLRAVCDTCGEKFTQVG